MSGTLDDALANAITLGQASDAYTTGTPNNQALLVAANALQAGLTNGLAQFETALAAVVIETPADVQAALNAAQYLAQGHAALAWVTNTLTILDRP